MHRLFLLLGAFGVHIAFIVSRGMFISGELQHLSVGNADELSCLHKVHFHGIKAAFLVKMAQKGSLFRRLPASVGHEK